MPSFLDEEYFDQHTTVGGFQFSAAKLEKVEAQTVTLVTLAVDVSGSVYSFAKDIGKMTSEVVKSTLANTAIADNVLIRIVTFESNTEEVLGFSSPQIADKIDWQTEIPNRIGGATALFRATEDGLRSMATYGRTLINSDYNVNGMLVVITDGDDNQGRGQFTANSVKSAMEGALKSENLESLLSILVRVDSKGNTNLDNFFSVAGFTQQIDIGATAKEIAKLAGFISQSVSAQSKSVGSGSASQALTF